MNTQIRALLAQKATAIAAMRALTAAAGDNDFTAEQQAQYDGHNAALLRAAKRIERETELLALEAAMPSAVQLKGDGSDIVVQENIEQDGKRGFKTLGEFTQAVVAAGRSGNRVMDKRLTIEAAAPSTYGNEGSGVDGGFAVPPTYSSELFRLSLLDNALLPYTSNANVDGNTMAYPKTEQTPWGTNGVRMYWQAEAGAGTQTKPNLGLQTLRLHKLLGLVPLSDELIADAGALQTEISSLLADSLKWKVNEAILNGNGNGQPLGALASSGPVITAPKDSGQAANTLSVTNLFTMLSRLPVPTAANAIWLIHPTVIPVLGTLVLGQIPVFLPGGMANVPSIGQVPVFGRILGLPVLISHHCATLSSAGDVQLLDLSYYRTITKAGGVQTDTSMHLYFDADAMALRVTFRIDGSPKIQAPINPAKGSTTLSPFIQLQNR